MVRVNSMADRASPCRSPLDNLKGAVSVPFTLRPSLAHCGTQFLTKIIPKPNVCRTCYIKQSEAGARSRGMTARGRSFWLAQSDENSTAGYTVTQIRAGSTDGILLACYYFTVRTLQCYQSPVGQKRKGTRVIALLRIHSSYIQPFVRSVAYSSCGVVVKAAGFWPVRYHDVLCCPLHYFTNGMFAHVQIFST